MRTFLVGFVTVVLAACGKSTDPTTTGPDVMNAVAADAATAVSTMVEKGVESDASSGLATAAEADAQPVGAGDQPTTIAGRLDEERRARSHVKPEVEDVFAAFASGGLTIADVKQGVARTSRARYCEFGTSPGGHRVLVCEFADASEAERGTAFMASQLVDPRRRVEQHGRLALTVLLTAVTPAADQERTKLFELFHALPR